MPPRPADPIGQPVAPAGSDVPAPAFNLFDPSTYLPELGAGNSQEWWRRYAAREHDREARKYGAGSLFTGRNGGYNSQLAADTSARGYLAATNPNLVEDVGYDAADQDQSRGYQTALIQQLHAAAQGDPNSLGQQQLRQSSNAAAGQVGGALAARGNVGGSGAAMRMASNYAGGIQRGAVDQSRLLMLQEQQSAQQALAQLYQQQAGQDMGLAGAQAANTLGNNELEDFTKLGYAQSGSNYDNNAAQAQFEAYRAKMGFDLDAQSINKEAQRQRERQLLQSGGTLLDQYSNMGNDEDEASGYGDGGGPIDEAFDGG